MEVVTVSDSELVNRIKHDDEKAYHMLFDRYWEYLYRISQAILTNKDLSQDILQDVWLGFWERRQQVENKNIRAYLVQAVKFRVYKELRDGKITVEHEKYLADVTAPLSIDEQHDYRELTGQMKQWVKELPAKCREVFELSRFEQLSNKEIARNLNISQRTVETHISNALKHLKGKMGLITFWFYFLS